MAPQEPHSGFYRRDVSGAVASVDWTQLGDTSTRGIEDNVVEFYVRHVYHKLGVYVDHGLCGPDRAGESTRIDGDS